MITHQQAGIIWVTTSTCDCRFAFALRYDDSGEVLCITSVACRSFPRCGYPFKAAQASAQAIFDKDCVEAKVVQAKEENFGFGGEWEC